VEAKNGTTFLQVTRNKEQVILVQATADGEGGKSLDWWKEKIDNDIVKALKKRKKAQTDATAAVEQQEQQEQRAVARQQSDGSVGSASAATDEAEEKAAAEKDAKLKVEEQFGELTPDNLKFFVIVSQAMWLCELEENKQQEAFKRFLKSINALVMSVVGPLEERAMQLLDLLKPLLAPVGAILKFVGDILACFEAANTAIDTGDTTDLIDEELEALMNDEDRKAAADEIRKKYVDAVTNALKARRTEIQNDLKMNTDEAIKRIKNVLFVRVLYNVVLPVIFLSPVILYSTASAYHLYGSISWSPFLTVADQIVEMYKYSFGFFRGNLFTFTFSFKIPINGPDFEYIWNTIKSLTDIKISYDVFIEGAKRLMGLNLALSIIKPFTAYTNAMITKFLVFFNKLFEFFQRAGELTKIFTSVPTPDNAIKASAGWVSHGSGGLFPAGLLKLDTKALTELKDEMAKKLNVLSKKKMFNVPYRLAASESYSRAQEAADAAREAREKKKAEQEAKNRQGASASGGMGSSGNLGGQGGGASANRGQGGASRFRFRKNRGQGQAQAPAAAPQGDLPAIEQEG